MDHSPYRDNPDLQDYYETVPPAHRLSGMNTPSSFSANDIPLQDSVSRSYGSQPLAQESSAHFNAYHNINGTEGDQPYAPNNDWMEKGASRSSGGKKKWWTIGGIVVCLCAVAGIVAGVVVSKNRSSSSSSSSSTAVTQTDPDDPSTFEKNSALINSFYGIAYTPEGSQYPGCGNSLTDIITDIQLMSQITTRIRLYGADCNQSALVLEAINQTKTNLTVWLGNYISISDGGVAYVRQRDVLQSTIQTYGTDHISGITVGNEVMLDYVTDLGITDVNSDAANVGAELLIANITDTKSMLADMSISLEVGTADAGAYFNDLVMAQVDYAMANVHPWFANVTIDDAAAWTWEFFQTNDVEATSSLSNIEHVYIAETGWPTQSSDVADETNGPSEASVANLQIFLDTFVCNANANGTEYFFFEFYDEEWKDEEFGGVEGWWGLFNANRTLKDGLTIPSC